MARFIVRRLRRAAALALAGLGCAAAWPLVESEVRLSAREWDQVRRALDWPELAIRRVHALQLGDPVRRMLEVEVDSEYLQRADDYRTWMRTLCSNETGAWKCGSGEEVVQPVAGGAVTVGPEVSPQDVLLLARFIGHAPGRAEERELLSVRATGALYQVSYRWRGCEHLVRLRREGDRFMLAHPRLPGVSACP